MSPKADEQKPETPEKDPIEFSISTSNGEVDSSRNVTINVSIRNNSESQVNNLTYYDKLEKGLEFESSSDQSVIYDFTTDTITYKVESLNTGEEVVFSYTIKVTDRKSGKLSIHNAEIEYDLNGETRAQTTSLGFADNSTLVNSDSLIVVPDQSGDGWETAGRYSLYLGGEVLSQEAVVSITPADIPGNGPQLQFNLELIQTTVPATTTGGELSEQDINLSEAVETEFSSPAYLEVNLDGVADLTNIPADQEPYVATYDEENNVWVKVPIVETDPESNSVTVEAAHFSTWGVGLGNSLPKNGANVLLFDQPYTSLFTGASRYSVPIWTPPGRAGVSPDISLSYSSATVDGVLGDVQAPWVGVGWNIDGIEIVRKITTNENGYGYVNNFALTLNGTVYELLVDPNTPNRYYTKQGSFLYIERHNFALGNSNDVTNETGEWWEVVTTDGTHYRLGWDVDSEQLALMYGYGCKTGNPCTTPGGAYAILGYAGKADNLVALRWRVDLITDSHGNTISYSYTETKPVEATTLAPFDRESYLHTISYTGFESTSGTLLPGYQVEFVTASRSTIGDVPTTFNIWDNLDSKYLEEIRIRCLLCDPDPENQIVRTYDFDYSLAAVPNANGTLTLTAIKISGEEFSESGQTVQTVNAPTIKFTYQNLGNRNIAGTSNDAYTYPRLQTINNGTGGILTYNYESDGRGTNSWYDYRVKDVNVNDGLDTAAAQAYSYVTPIYAGSGGDPSLGDLIGYTSTSEKQLDYINGNAVILETKHDFGTQGLDTGYELKTDWLSGASVLKRTTNTYVTDNTKAPFSGWNYRYLFQTVNYVNNSGTLTVASKAVYLRDPATGNLLLQTDYLGNAAYRKTYYEYLTNTNPAEYILDKASRVLVVNASSAVLTDTHYHYDGTRNIAPSRGDLTLTQTLTGSGNTTVNSGAHYDEYGNVDKQTQYITYGLATDPPTLNIQDQESLIEYDSLFHTYPVTQTNPLGESTSTKYLYHLGVPYQATDANGWVTTTTYDSLGRQLSITVPGVSDESVWYIYPVPNGNGVIPAPYNVEMQILDTAAGAYRSVWGIYDGMGRQIQMQVFDDDTDTILVTDTEFNPQGAVSRQSSPHQVSASGGFYTDPDWGQSTNNLYDALGRVTKVTQPGDLSTTTAYDGFLTTTVNPNGQKTDRGNDGLGRLTYVREYSNSSTVYTTTRYLNDELNRLVQVTDAQANITTLTYDWLGRKTSMDDPDMGVWTYQYNPSGTLSQQTDARNETLTFTYDALNRLLTKTGNGVNTTNTYGNSTGNYDFRIGMSDGSGTTEWTYDNYGRTVTEVRAFTGATAAQSMTTTSDWLGRPLSVTYPDGEVLTYAYDALGRPDNFKSSSGPAVPLVDLTYNVLGQVTKQALGNGIQITNTYDSSNNRLLSRASTGNIINFGYTYDPAGNITGITDGKFIETHQYTYDFLNRLTTANAYTTGNTSEIKYSQQFEYDKVGNINQMNDWVVPTPLAFRENDSAIVPVVYKPPQLSSSGSHFAAPALQTGATETPVATPVNYLFTDGFESGDLLSWSGNTTDAGDLSVSTGAAMAGTYGMQALIDDTTAIYVTDDSPNAELLYRARFDFDPNSLVMADADYQYIFQGYANSTNTNALRVAFKNTSGLYQLNARILNDSAGWQSTPYVTITDEPHTFEVEWGAASTAGANDGYLTFWIDGVQQGSLVGIDNDTYRMERARLGPTYISASSTSGTVYFDAFESYNTVRSGSSGTDTPTPTATSDLIATPTYTPTPTATVLPTETETPTHTPSATPTITPTSTKTKVPTNTGMPSPTYTPTPTPTITPSYTATFTPTFTPSDTVVKNWPFNTSVEDWSSPANISGYSWQSGGTVGGTISGVDPMIYEASALGINAASNKFISIRYKNSTPGTVAQFYFITEADRSWNEAKSKAFTVSANSNFTEYILDMSAVSGWTGTIRQLRFDPAGTSGTFSIDYIQVGTRYLTPTPSQTPTPTRTSTPTYTPTATPTATPWTGVDDYTVVLLHMDGANAATSFTDASGKVWAANGNAQINTAQSKFGGASALLDGSGDYLSSADSNDFTFGNGDFTVDFWVRFNALPATGQLMSFWSQSQNADNFFIFDIKNISGVYYLLVQQVVDGVYTLSFGKQVTIAAGAWYHVAYVRSGNEWKFFLNGVQVGTTETYAITLANLNAPVTIGQYYSAYYLNGRIDEFRVSKGVARWTSDFTPPSVPYNVGSTPTPMPANTATPGYLGNLSAYWNFENAGPSTVPDEAGNFNNFATLAGSPLVDSTASFNEKSILFASSGQYASVADQVEIKNNGSFTISAWVNPASLVTDRTQYIVQKGDTNKDYGLITVSTTGTATPTPVTGQNSPIIANGALAFQVGDLTPNILYGPILPVNTWTMVTGVYDSAAGQMRLYLNGHLVASQVVTGVVSMSTSPLTFGSSNTAYRYHGRLDEVRFYNRALTDTEVQSISSIFITPTPPVVTETPVPTAAAPNITPIPWSQQTWGTGNDGDLTIASGATININTQTNGNNGRTCADGVAYNVIQLGDVSTVLDSSSVAGCLNAGDEILLIQLSGNNPSDYNAGSFEFLRVASANGTAINFATPKTKWYGSSWRSDSGIGTGSGQIRVMLMRVPNYNNVTINGTLTASAFNGNKYGLVVFRVAGELKGSGAISAEGLGFPGGQGYAPGAIGGWGYTHPGGGGGGGYGTAGTAGLNGVGDSAVGGSGGGIFGIQTLDRLYMGSGGGSGGPNNGSAGAAGGGIILIAGRIINFTGVGLTSKGGRAGLYTYSGGGSGGSIRIEGETINATISAAGGSNYENTGGFGGKGRMAVYYYNTLSSNLTANSYTYLQQVNPNATPTAAPAEPSENPSTMGLVSWWTLNEANGTRSDSYGANHLTDNNTVASAAGLKGNAASFVIANLEFLSIADNPSISTGNIDFSLVANVYMNTTTSTMIIANKGDKANGNMRDFSLYYYQPTGQFAFKVGNGSTNVAVVSANTVSAGQWYTIVAWHDSASDTLNLQINNGNVNTVSYSGGAIDTAYAMSIGAFEDGTHVLDGRIDEVTIYKRVLTSAERTWFYNNGAGRTYTDLASVSPPPTNPGTSGLVSWWTLDETSGTRNDSQGANLLTDNNTVAPAAGLKGNSAKFVAANLQSLSIADNANLSLNGTSFTIAGWAKFSTLGTAQSLISKLNTGNYEYQIYKSTADQIVFAVYGNTSGTLTGAVATSTLVSANTWYFIVAQYDGATVKISLNGDTFTSAAYASGVADGTNQFRLGAHGSGAYTNGMLDEVVIYKRVLTQSELTWLYNSGAGRTYSDLAAVPPPQATLQTKKYTYSTDIPHAVTSLTDAAGATQALYEYDANGNMTCRLEGNALYKQTYNTENRISSIQKLRSGACADANPLLETKWDFAYDGDGTRTATLTTPFDASGQPQTATLTSYYFGGAYEVTGSTIRKYYSFAGQTIALRELDTATPGTSTLSYFLTDILGSVVAVTNETGTLISEQRYLPFGGERTNIGAITQTDFGYTGQRKLDSGMGGLMDYKARFYSPYINRFLQPDTLIPDPSSPQAWNRFSYVKNNPINFNDPTGHFECNDPNGCTGPGDDNAGSGVVIDGGGNHDDDDDDDIEDELQQDSCTYHLCSEDGNLYELGWSNFGQAWSIWSNPNASYWQRYGAGTYMSFWGGAHVMAAVGGAILLRQGIIVLGTQLATLNPNASTTSIGRFPQYINIAKANGYTAFNLGRFYTLLNALGLAKPMNQQFMSNQFSQGKDFVSSGVAEIGTGLEMETAMIQSSQLYVQLGNGWQSLSNFYSNTVSWWLE